MVMPLVLKLVLSFSVARMMVRIPAEVNFAAKKQAIGALPKMYIGLPCKGIFVSFSKEGNVSDLVKFTFLNSIYLTLVKRAMKKESQPPCWCKWEGSVRINPSGVMMEGNSTDERGEI